MKLPTVSRFPSMILAAAICMSVAGQALSAPFKEVTLLPANERTRILFSNQPNLEKSEFVLPKQEAMIFVVKQPLKEFIKQFSTIQNLKLTMSESVRGELEKISLPMKLEKLMIELSKAYGIEWHLRGDHLFVSNSLENTNRLIDLGTMNFDKLKRALAAANIVSGANTITFSQDKNQVLIIGSQKYISKIEGVIKTYQSGNQSQKSQKPNVKRASN